MSTANAWRERALASLTQETFDLLVVGGGITGAGVARDAALRGLKVALVEKLDFAAGTSSKSSKLVHGGLRYLEQAQLGLVFESVNERRLLTTRARHLVRPLAFLVTRFKGFRHPLVLMDVGLWIYEALCLFRAHRLHRTYGRKKTLALEPLLRADGLTGGIVYFDCQTDDARLTLENVLDAQDLGAVVLNHARAGKLLREADGRVVGAEVTDTLSGRTLPVRAKVVVNASGPWSDEVRALRGDGPMLKPAKGVHVVVDERRLPVRHALMMISPRDQRVVFAIPWGLGRTIIGTTDTFFKGSLDEVHTDRADAEYLLDTANHYVPSAKLTFDDVLASWAGLRPLLDTHDAGESASHVPREHVLVEEPGFITIAGGKLTTYRSMAAEVVDTALGQLGQKLPCTTGERPLPGSVGLDTDEALGALAQPLVQLGASEAQAQALVGLYGVRAQGVLARTAQDATLKAPLDPEVPFLMAQVDEAVERELAVTLDDVLTRRIPLVLRARDQGLGIAPRVAARMATLLGWDATRVQRELDGYQRVVDASRQFKRA